MGLNNASRGVPKGIIRRLMIAMGRRKLMERGFKGFYSAEKGCDCGMGFLFMLTQAICGGILIESILIGKLVGPRLGALGVEMSWKRTRLRQKGSNGLDQVVRRRWWRRATMRRRIAAAVSGGGGGRRRGLVLVLVLTEMRVVVVLVVRGHPVGDPRRSRESQIQRKTEAKYEGFGEGWMEGDNLLGRQDDVASFDVHVTKWMFM